MSSFRVMKKLSLVLWKKAQSVLIRCIVKGSFFAPKILFFLAQYKDLNDETVRELIKLWGHSQEKSAIADKILSAHRYHYDNSRKTEADLMKFLGRDLLLATKTRATIWSLP